MIFHNINKEIVFDKLVISLSNAGVKLMQKHLKLIIVSIYRFRSLYQMSNGCLQLLTIRVEVYLYKYIGQLNKNLFIVTSTEILKHYLAQLSTTDIVSL